MSIALEIKTHIKHLFKEILELESSKEGHQEQIFDHILNLIELYVKNEVELYMLNAMPEITETIIRKIKGDLYE